MGRQIALVGDAELDEGAVWEAIADPSVAKLGEVLWVVDLNRQSLDRVVPDIAFDRWAHMFEAAGWQTITVKYGSRLDALFERPGGPELRKRIDGMRNEEYQRLLRAEPEELRERLPGRGRKLAKLVGRAGRRRAARRAARPRRSRPRQADRGLPGGRPRPADRDLRLHDQGLGPADRGPPGEPLGAAHARADAELARRSAPTPTSPGPPSTRAAPRASCAPPRLPRSRATSPSRPRRRRCRRAGPRAQRPGVDPAGVRPLLRRPRARGARGRRAGGHGQPGRGQLDQPGRVAQQGGHLVGGRPPRLVRRRPADARALARVDRRPALRAGHRGDQPGRAAGRAGRDLEPLRPAAAADRDDLRPVRRARARALVVRHVRGRPVDPRGHAERAFRSRPRAGRTSRSSRPRSGSGSPAAPPGSRRLARTSSGRCCTRSARLGRADGESAYFRLSTRPIDQALAGGELGRRASSSWPAAIPPPREFRASQ